MDKSSEKGIRHKYLRLTLSSLLICSLLIAGIYFYMDSQQDERQAEYDELTEKQETLQGLSEALNQLFFRTRGYYAFQNQEELRLAYVELAILKSAIERLEGLSISEEEQEEISDLTTFITTFETQVFPQAIAAVQNDDEAALRNLSNDGTNATVNEFVAFADEYKSASEADLEQLNEDMIRQSENFSFMLILLFILLFIITALIIYRAMNDIVKPLEGMRESIEGFGNGEQVSYIPLERKDEIGLLSQTFQRMMNTIRENQEDLTSQNQALLLNKGQLQD